jgi:hypothetical protein
MVKVPRVVQRNGPSSIKIVLLGHPAAPRPPTLMLVLVVLVIPLPTHMVGRGYLLLPLRIKLPRMLVVIPWLMPKRKLLSVLAAPSLFRFCGHIIMV